MPKPKAKKKWKEVSVPVIWFEGLIQAFELVNDKEIGNKYLEGYIESAKSIITPTRRTLQK